MQVPGLSAFLLLTIFPQLPLAVFNAEYGYELYPIDRIVGIPMILFLVSFAVSGVGVCADTLRR